MAEPNQVETIAIPRPVRVVFPVQVRFEGEEFSIDEFTANLSVGGLFLPTERMIPPRTRGTLTFRISQWEKPFTVEAEVVRTAPPGGGPVSPDRLRMLTRNANLRPQIRARAQAALSSQRAR
jgi:hypothetical protein